MNCYRRYNKGFTLIEVLIVIAIISIIAAILFPIFASARGKARQAQCTSNLRQIGQAVLMYVQDNDGVYLPYGQGGLGTKAAPTIPTCPSWILKPYVKTTAVWVCPSETNATALAQTDPRIVSYQFNAGSASSNPLGYTGYESVHHYVAGVNESNLKYPATTVAATDADPGENGWTEGDTWDTTASLGTTDWPVYIPGGCLDESINNKIAPCGYNTFTTTQSPWFVRHSGGFNALFLDGHVRWYVGKNGSLSVTNFVPPLT